jgi:formate-dependent nitrite reductase cytochrome c552 subunit
MSQDHYSYLTLITSYPEAMKKFYVILTISTLLLASMIFLLGKGPAYSQPVTHKQDLVCKDCHPDEFSNWSMGRHAMTQVDVANELAANWQGQTPDSVIFGSQAENCVACHSPTAVTTLGGMTEVQVMGHYFTTTGGKYTDSTTIADAANWPHVWCTSCHNVPPDHPTSLPTVSIFNSTTASYDEVPTSSVLCGQCHGTLRFPETDHRIYDGWKLSKHGHKSQADVASELASDWAGKTPDEVINGPDAENCIACHAPTSVHPLQGDTTEVMALSHFFTTVGGVFTATTMGADTIHFPDVACNSCHNPHHPEALSFYNSTSRQYETFVSSNQLCGQCHGNLRFAHTDHLSYNIETGTGGIGVPDEVMMPGAGCVDCHMHADTTPGTNAALFGGHRFSVFIQEPGGTIYASCTKCHESINADSSQSIVIKWQHDFAQLDSIAQIKVAVADTLMQGNTDTLKLRYLDEAKQNLGYAESNESGGAHNHTYLVSLLTDAIQKAGFITGIYEIPGNGSQGFALNQNYPNPFSSETKIRFSVPSTGNVSLTVYDLSGHEVVTLVNQSMKPGQYISVFSAGNLRSGIYYYCLKAGNFSETKKMILMR